MSICHLCYSGNLGDCGVEKMINQIICGSALDVLKSMPDNFVDCVITSPPYWGLRDYGVSGQLGLEPTFQEYIGKLVEIFDEVKRVLKPTGTCWVNLGDSYSGSGGAGGDYNPGGLREGQPKFKQGKADVPAKSLCCIPDRFKIGMVDSGWICRNEIIWYKRNCMPSSAAIDLPWILRRYFSLRSRVNIGLSSSLSHQEQLAVSILRKKETREVK